MASSWLLAVAVIVSCGMVPIDIVSLLFWGMAGMRGLVGMVGPLPLTFRLCQLGPPLSTVSRNEMNLTG